MSLFRVRRWLRHFFRRHSPSIATDTARKYKLNLSYAYAFFAWNLFGYILYKTYSGGFQKIDKSHELSQAREFAKLLKKEDVIMYRVEGLTPKGRFDLKQEFAEMKQREIENEFVNSIDMPEAHDEELLEHGESTHEE
ncbi:uncharacterized protein LOC143039574 [Oratosquilla oratoria]|uniref:uncharacterized protein LOC143039574 n=1 Tax=Oratosquilla oratoria TaxID=337810 RepID=UPI003F76D784